MVWRRARQAAGRFPVLGVPTVQAGLMAARASYIAGFAGTATVLAGKLLRYSAFGTMRILPSRPMITKPLPSEIAHARPEGLVF
jgi:nicotinate phosphoribosyltransferase